MRKALLIVEGQHDLALIGRLLKGSGISQIWKKSEVDPFWLPLIPARFPHDDDLRKRMPVPSFFLGTINQVELSIAVHCANGNDEIGRRLAASLVDIDLSKLSSIGIVTDRDDADPVKRFDELIGSIRNELISKAVDFSFCSSGQPGVVSARSPRFGVYIMPDNRNPGTLERLLIESGERIFPSLLEQARTYVDKATKEAVLLAGDLREFRKPAGEEKAVCASIGAILKPGKAIQVSIEDTRWIPVEEAQQGPLLRDFTRFLRDLLLWT